MLEFQNPYLLLLAILSVPIIYQAIKLRGSQYQSALLFTKALFILMAAIALAQPSLVVETEISTERSVDFIDDRSESSELIERSESESLTPDSSPQNTEQVYSDLRSSIEEGNTVLIRSDMQMDMDRLEESLEDYNGSVNVVEADMEEDYSVIIEGPDEVVPGTEVEYEVEVKATGKGDTPEPRLTVDGSTKTLQQSEEANKWIYTDEFESEGASYDFKAEIEPQGKNEENSKYYKAVEVIDRPEVLVLGDGQGSFSNQVESVYDFEIRQNIPEDLTSFDSIVVQDRELLNQEVKNYVAEGNGLLYTGEPFESPILPLNQGSPIESETEMEETADSVILIDASVSRQGEPIEKSKAMAHNLIDSMPDSTNLGLAAYNNQGYEIQPLTQIQTNREDMKQKVSRIDPEGPTYHQEGLKTAENMLNGQGNIIMITDGLLSRINRVRGVPEQTINTSQDLQSQLIVLDTNPFVNPEFLKNITKETNGEYITADNQGSLSFAFEARQTETRHQPLIATDSTHFITRNNVQATTSPRHNTGTKQGAQKLIQNQGTPYLSTWRYGLGRTAQINDEDSTISRLDNQDPETVSRTIGWTVGEPQDKEYAIDQNRKPNPINIYRKEDGTLQETITHQQTGIYTYQNQKYHYNYPEEIQNIGYNKDNINQITTQTDGEQVENPESWLEQKTSTHTTETTTESQNITKYIITLMTILFTLEIGFRKLKGKL